MTDMWRSVPTPLPHRLITGLKFLRIVLNCCIYLKISTPLDNYLLNNID